MPIRRLRRPDTIISSIQKRDPFQAPLYNDQGSQYLVDISVGTPPQNFSVTLDTGSADLWIPGKFCPKTECPNNLFDEAKSSTFKDLGQSFGLTYGIGSVNGTYVTDTVSISGATVQNQQFGLASYTKQILTNPNTITAENVGATTMATSDFIKSSLSKIWSLASASPSSSSSSSLTELDSPVGNGILGLGYPKLTAASSNGHGAYTPFVFQLAAQNLIKEPVFSIYLNSANAQGWAGELILGGVDSTKYSGNITYLPVVSLSSTRASKSKTKKKRSLPDNNNYYYWMVGAKGISVSTTDSATSSTNKRSVDANAQTNRSNSSTTTTTITNAVADNSNFTSRTLFDVDLSSSTGAFILDTGTTLTYLPSSIAKQIVETFAGSEGYTTDTGSGAYIIDCNTAKSNTQLIFKMSSGDSANPVTLSIPASQLVIALDSSSPDDASYCIFGIAPTTTNAVSSNLYLVGDSILRSIYMVFDMGNNRVGIASAAGVGGAVQGVSSVGHTSQGFLRMNNPILSVVSSLSLFVTAYLCL
ncbi:aspartic peptidase domain-containing protein [Mycotypha africana]|uniref:aspartic peptidase domain-containing protein n=1 Tax=Mycotypha africana TaxID=64632 RepID=UPI0023009188|nr:aspartic peptidase domain-containing protein [Mycotypha africana]KAI8969274.1 aspartic peptidase domain-containing protein [Mycotypha africana]